MSSVNNLIPTLATNTDTSCDMLEDKNDLNRAADTVDTDDDSAERVGTKSNVSNVSV